MMLLQRIFSTTYVSRYKFTNAVKNLPNLQKSVASEIPIPGNLIKPSIKRQQLCLLRLYLLSTKVVSMMQQKQQQQATY